GAVCVPALAQAQAEEPSWESPSPEAPASDETQAESTSSESTEMESPPPVEASAPADETLTEVAEETAPDMPAEDPAEPAEAKPKLNVGMGIRVGTALVFDDPAADGPALRLHDGVGSQLNVRPYFS